MTSYSGIDPSVAPSGPGCVECETEQGWWVHLRRCAQCGHVGCCDTSPRQHANAHYEETGHPVVQSFEPGEDWFWDYALDDVVAAPGSPTPSTTPSPRTSPAPRAGCRPTGRSTCTEPGAAGRGGAVTGCVSKPRRRYLRVRSRGARTRRCGDRLDQRDWLRAGLQGGVVAGAVAEAAGLVGVGQHHAGAADVADAALDDAAGDLRRVDLGDRPGRAGRARTAGGRCGGTASRSGRRSRGSPASCARARTLAWMPRSTRCWLADRSKSPLARP